MRKKQYYSISLSICSYQTIDLIIERGAYYQRYLTDYILMPRTRVITIS